MLLLDRRIGSGELRDPLVALGLPVDVVTLDYGDCAFLGNGPAGERTMQIGAELKKIHDLVSSLETGRLSGHQLPGLVKQYDIVYLIIEGLWRPGADGTLELYRRGKWIALEHGQRRYMYAEIDNRLTTLEEHAGFRLRRTANEHETAYVIKNLYRRWTNKEYDQHRSHLALHRPMDTALLVPAPLRRRVAQELPGVGFEKSITVTAHFKTTRRMVDAGDTEWMKIPGIGKTLAKRIVEIWDKE